MTTTSDQFKPRKTARQAYTDHELTIYEDGTWQAHVEGIWLAPIDAVIYAEGTGDARITTKWGHNKVSRVTTPSGRHLDIRKIATKGHL